MTIPVLEITDPRWRAFIATHRDATIFHHPAWIGLLAECYGYRPRLPTVLDEAGQIAAGLPLLEVNSRLTGRRAVALPFSDFCAPLARDETALDQLVVSLLNTHAQHKRRVEIHWPLPHREGIYAGATMLRHVTPLAREPKQVSARFKSSVMRLVRQAESAEVCVKWGESWDDLRLFYNLHLQTRRRLGVPIQPLRFFRLLWERLLAQGLGFVLLAFKEQTPIAGAVFLHWNGVLVYKYGASLSEYWQLRPNNLLFWHAIRWGCAQGCQSFDWGRTDMDDEGLRNFKRGWGSDESVLHYSVLADRAPTAKTASSHLLAPLLQRSPTWVGRALGELLYGHFG